jgi:putrescine transport system ATP-binding protein
MAISDALAARVPGNVTVSVSPAADGERPLIYFDKVTKRFGRVVAVDRVSLGIRRGEFFALLGPSGCGKTTLLRLLAGFEAPDEGHVLLDGDDMAPVPPYRRPVNMVFQSYALFPHLSVHSNIAFGLKQDRLPREEIDRRVREILGLVKLEGTAARKPDQLSGGQRQRVALARALVKRPRVLLLDEPMAALDRKLREQTRFELMDLQKRLGLTFVIVTHDRDEAMTVADRIAVMERGHIVQVATPRTIYEEPRSRFVADFIGEVNLFEGRVVSTGPSETAIEIGRNRRLLATEGNGARLEQTVWVAVRPEKIAIASEQSAEAGVNSFAGQVIDIAYLGDMSVYQVRLEDGPVVKASALNRAPHLRRMIARTERVWLSWPADAGIVLTQ